MTERDELLVTLCRLNLRLARLGALPVITGEEAETCPDGRLEDLVGVTWDRLATVARAVSEQHKGHADV